MKAYKLTIEISLGEVAADDVGTDLGKYIEGYIADMTGGWFTVEQTMKQEGTLEFKPKTKSGTKNA